MAFEPNSAKGTSDRDRHHVGGSSRDNPVPHNASQATSVPAASALPPAIHGKGNGFLYMDTHVGIDLRVLRERVNRTPVAVIGSQRL